MITRLALILVVAGLIILSAELSLIICWKLHLFDGRWFPKKLREAYEQEKNAK